MKAFVASVVSMWALQGWAEPAYPAQFAETWPAITYTGQGMECRLCHFSVKGGDRDVVFGAKFESSGKAGETAARLKALFNAKSDVDADGCPDFDELSAKPQTNPNDKTSKPKNCPADPPKPDAGTPDAGTPDAGAGGGGAGSGGSAGGGGGSAGGGSGGGSAGGGIGSAGGGSAMPRVDGGTGGSTRPPDPGGCNSSGFGGLSISLLMLIRLLKRESVCSVSKNERGKAKG